jgi:hypothetical protein
VLGIPGVGAGGFRHFVEKYDRAKAFCERPFETVKRNGGRKTIVAVEGERIAARLVSNLGDLHGQRSTLLKAGSIDDEDLGQNRFDGIFTDPPYFDNVQYAELMDFCYAWLRPLLRDEFPEFAQLTTRSLQELTGNTTLGRDLAHFTKGLSRVFSSAAAALRPDAPFVFTYHHNDVEAYVPVVVSVLDAGLVCTATLPCPAEMTASLHINGTASSIVDTIVVCRRRNVIDKPRVGRATLSRWLSDDRQKLFRGSVQCTQGDLYCLALGHLARAAISSLHGDWNRSWEVGEKMATAQRQLKDLANKCELDAVVNEVLGTRLAGEQLLLGFRESLEAGVLD